MTIATDRLVDEASTGSPDFPNGMPTVDGVPIVESGSNSDGEWLKFSDRTLRCYGSMSDLSWGAGATDNRPWNFPQPFISLPSSWATAYTGSPQVYNAATASPGLTSVTAYVGGSQAASGSIGLHAIGHWK